MTTAFSEEQKRFAGWLPEAILAVGAVAIVGDWVLFVDADFRGDPMWAGANIVAWLSASTVRWKRPDLPISLWLILMFSSASTTAESVVDRLVRTGADTSAIAWTNLAGTAAAALGIVAAVHTIGLFPEGRAETKIQRRVTRAAWLLLVPPIGLAFATTEIPLEYYLDAPQLDNPLHVMPFSAPAELAGGTVTGLVGIGTALTMLVARYRRSDRSTQRRIRILMLPAILLVIALPTAIVLRERGQFLTWILLLAAMYSLAPSLAIGAVQPSRFDIDRVVRRLLVSGVLWLMVTSAFVAAAILVGVTAGAYLPVEWSITVALIAAVFFQPARVRLDAMVDRWVFGERTDPGKVIERLGETLAMTFDLDTLLARMVAALEEGLGLTWARVRLTGVDSGVGSDPAVAVPISLDGQELGFLECGPKHKGIWTDADRHVVATFAGHAALAVHNVKLTESLTVHVAQIAASRARLVRAQETERRRIERNIHDGVQQDLVALIGLAGQIRRESPTDTADDLVALQDGLTHVLNELRDLAKGIHPSLLSDQGVLIAIEALAARHPIPVAVRADPDIRGISFAAEAEGAVYFAVAEALANSLKHSHAQHVEVTLARDNGSLITSVSDDGVGFDCADVLGNGSGLAGLRDRISALDGTLDVISTPGRGTTVMAEVIIGDVAT